MLSQSDFPADFNENRILYKKQVINNIQVFVYSNDPNDELFDVRFTNVGDNEGNYILLSNNTIENIYEYVNPINGIKQGNYEPVIFLIPPKKLQLITYNSEFKISNNSNLNFEIAASMKDENLFSNINDNNNYGLASKINFISINKINSKYNLIELGPGKATLFMDIANSVSKLPGFLEKSEISFKDTIDPS